MSNNIQYLFYIANHHSLQMLYLGEENQDNTQQYDIKYNSMITVASLLFTEGTNTAHCSY